MLYIKETKSTPFVQLSVEDCQFEIKGLSFSNDIDSFYSPILKWIDTEFINLECDLECKFYFSVLNSVTFKYILSMMVKFMKFNKEGKNIKVLWHYDKHDDDIRENAEDISDLFGIPIELIEV